MDEKKTRDQFAEWIGGQIRIPQQEAGGDQTGADPDGGQTGGGQSVTAAAQAGATAPAGTAAQARAAALYPNTGDGGEVLLPRQSATPRESFSEWLNNNLRP